MSSGKFTQKTSDVIVLLILFRTSLEGTTNVVKGVAERCETLPSLHTISKSTQEILDKRLQEILTQGEVEDVVRRYGEATNATIEESREAILKQLQPLASSSEVTTSSEKVIDRLRAAEQLVSARLADLPLISHIEAVVNNSSVAAKDNCTGSAVATQSLIRSRAGEIQELGRSNHADLLAAMRDVREDIRKDVRAVAADGQQARRSYAEDIVREIGNKATGISADVQARNNELQEVFYGGAGIIQRDIRSRALETQQAFWRSAGITWNALTSLERTLSSRAAEIEQGFRARADETGRAFGVMGQGIQEEVRTKAKEIRDDIKALQTDQSSANRILMDETWHSWQHSMRQIHDETRNHIDQAVTRFMSKFKNLDEKVSASHQAMMEVGAKVGALMTGEDLRNVVRNEMAESRREVCGAVSQTLVERWTALEGSALEAQRSAISGHEAAAAVNQQQLERRGEQLEQVKAALFQEKDRRRELQASLTRLQKELGDERIKSTSDLGKKEEEIHFLEDKVSKGDTDLTDLRRQVEELAGKVQQKEGEIDGLREELRTRDTEKEAAEQRHGELQQLLTRRDTTIQGLETRLGEAKVADDHRKRRLEEAQKKLDAVEEQGRITERDLQSSAALAKERLENTERLGLDISEKNLQLKKLQEVLDKDLQLRVQYLDEMENFKKREAALKQDLENESGRVVVLEKQLEQGKKEILSLQADNNSMQATLVETTDRLVVAERERDEARALAAMHGTPKPTPAQLPQPASSPDPRKRIRSEVSFGDDASELSRLFESVARQCGRIHVAPPDDPDLSLRDIAAEIMPIALGEESFIRMNDFIEQGSNEWHCLAIVSEQGTEAQPAVDRICQDHQHGEKCCLVRVRDHEGKKKLDFVV